jgi:Domain of unknown function (DUF4364)
MTDSLTLYKLIILYTLNKVTFPLTNSQVTEFILEKGYTTYFTLQQALNELTEAELIKVKHIRNSSHYSILPSGTETLGYFGDHISDAIKHDVDVFLSQHKYELRSENETLADYDEEKKNQFIVSCAIKEKGVPLVEIKLNVTDEEQAIAICNNWNKKNADVYSYLISHLLLK